MIVFPFPEQAALGEQLGHSLGEWQWRHFPDGESYVRVLSDVKGEATAILCSLNQPDAKTLPLIFLARTLKEMGAAKVTLIAPYLGYMRQDARFNAGEAVTADIFARLLSPFIDALITMDPHLHRHHALEEIYRCECNVLSAAPLMAQWIQKNIQRPLIIGPDVESEQWVKTVAANVEAPYIVLKKTRHGDRAVEITLPDVTAYHSHTPILVDDIISTAGTMIKTIGLLHAQGVMDSICLATHGLFVGDAYAELQKAGARTIITTDTILHPTNALSVAALISESLI